MTQSFEGHVPLIGQQRRQQQQAQQEIELPEIPKGWVVKVSVPGTATQYFCETVHPGPLTIIPEAFSHDASRSELVTRHRRVFLMQVPIIMETVPPPQWWGQRLMNNGEEE